MPRAIGNHFPASEQLVHQHRCCLQHLFLTNSDSTSYELRTLIKLQTQLDSPSECFLIQVSTFSPLQATKERQLATSTFSGSSKNACVSNTVKPSAACVIPHPSAVARQLCCPKHRPLVPLPCTRPTAGPIRGEKKDEDEEERRGPVSTAWRPVSRVIGVGQRLVDMEIGMMAATLLAHYHRHRDARLTLPCGRRL